MNEWREFFNEYAPNYNDEAFTKNTANEIAFLLEEFQLPEGAAILDIGCGTGRHSVRLAQHGYRMTGVDISQSMLQIASQAAKQAGVELRLVCTDAQEFTAAEQFDGAICLCEGALCLLGSGDDPLERDVKILKNIYAALKPGAKFIVNVLNGCRNLRLYDDAAVAAGKFDLLNMIELYEMEYATPQGKQRIHVRERVYTPPEFKRILTQAGFVVEAIYGGTAGGWNRQLPKLDEMELMAIAIKPNS